MKHLLSMSLIGNGNREGARDEIAALIFKAMEMLPFYATSRVVRPNLAVDCLPPVLTSVFLEPSTRTMFSTETAARLIGFEVSSPIQVEASSLKKGETVPNTVRMLGQYRTSVVVVRSQIEGLGVHLANIIEHTGGPMSWVPKEMSVLVGGSGTRDHPSQVLLDLTTLVLRRLGIRRLDEYQRVESILRDTAKESLLARIQEIIDGLCIAFVGDLLHSRVVHDWIHLAEWFNVKLILTAPDIFQLEPWCLQTLEPANYRVSEDMREALAADYVYMIRLQVERLKELMTENSAREIAGRFMMTEKFLRDYSGEVLDAQPVDQHSPAVPISLWNHPQNIMFMQSAVGVPVRMAILLTLWEHQREEWNVLPASSYSLKPVDVEASDTLAGHRERMVAKHSGSDMFFSQVDNGAVIDRIAPGCAAVIQAINRLGGFYDETDGPLIVATGVPSTAMGRKEMILIHGRRPSYGLAALYGLVCPDVKLICINRQAETEGGHGYQRVRLSLPEIVSGIFSCPNSNCVTNHDPEARTHFRVFGVRGGASLRCGYCGHLFPAETVVGLFRKRLGIS